MLRTVSTAVTSAWLSIATTSALLLIALAADIRLVAVGGLAVCLVQIFYRYPIALVCLWPVVHLLSVVFSDFSLTVGPFALQLMDPIYFLTVAHLSLWVIFHPAQMARIMKENVALTGFLILVVCYVCLYIPVHGHSALGEARKFYFMFFFPILALTALKRPEDIRIFFLSVLGVALCVACYAVARTVMTGTIVRSIYSSGALIAALVGCALLTLRIHRITTITPRLDTLIILLLFAVAIGTAHRTVWLATATGLVLTCWVNRKRTMVVAKMFMMFIVSTFVLSAAFAALPEMSSQLAAKFDGLINPTTDETGSWRIQGWLEQLRALEGAEVVLGNGVGGYYSWRQDRYVMITASPHNAYVQLVLKFGLLGLLIYLATAIGALSKAFSTRRRMVAGPLRAYIETGIVSYGAAHTYLLGYGFEPIILVFLGLLAVAVTLSRTCAEVAGQPTEYVIGPRWLAEIQSAR